MKWATKKSKKKTECKHKEAYKTSFGEVFCSKCHMKVIILDK